MRTVTALEVRQKFGQLIDEAAAGERLIIERGGHPIAAIVPLSDVPELNREARVKRRLQAIEDIRRLARANPVPLKPGEAAQVIRQQRDERAEHIWRVLEEARKSGR